MFLDAGETVRSVRELPCQVPTKNFPGHASRLPDPHAAVIVCADLGSYMNESGPAVATLLRVANLPPEHLVVVHDELALPLGRIRLDRNISAAGHNGVQSVIDHVGQGFVRVRLGIETRVDREVPGDAFVLQRFSRAEAAAVGAVKERAGTALSSLLALGLERTMAEFNRGN
jgi:PTH1 family peptidyl-tRNA hydrolase